MVRFRCGRVWWGLGQGSRGGEGLGGGGGIRVVGV